MKANELMIGDWVKFLSRYDYGIGKVACIEPREGSAEPSTFSIIKDNKAFIGVRRNNVEPIPLTPEILVANGFESRELYRFTLYQLGIESFSIAYDLLLKNLCAFTKTVKAGCRPSTTPDKSELSIHIQYVHELQQAMRLIGLRDLADNFVIEKGGAK